MRAIQGATRKDLLMARFQIPVLLTITTGCILLPFLGLDSPSDLPPTSQTAPATALLASLYRADAGSGEQREAAPRRGYELRRGEEVRLACRMALDSDLTQARGPAHHVAAGLQGTLQLSVVGERGTDLALAATMTDVVVLGESATNGLLVAQLRAELGQATLIHLSKRGEILGYRFAAMPAQHRNQLRALFACLCPTVGQPGETSWTSTDADATGDAIVLGAWDLAERTLTSQKTGYREGSAPILPHVDGRGSATLDATTGWWRELRYEETCTLSVTEAELRITAHATVHAELLAASAAVGHVAIDGEFDWEAPWAAASGAGDQAAETSDPEELALAAELRGVTLGAEFARLQELLSAAATDEDLYAARRRLLWLLRHDANALLELQGLLGGANVPAGLTGEVLSAVGAAGTPAAQDFLVALLAGSPATTTRVSAAQALFQSQMATPATLQAIRAALADTTAAPELHGTSLLLLGALAGHEHDAGSLAELLGREAFARDHGLVVDWLEALGNAGRAEATDAALAHFAAEAAEERAAAASAVRRLTGPRVFEALADRAQNDASPLVRSRAVETLAGHQGAEVVSLLEGILGRDQDETVRSSALLALAFRADPATATRVLTQVQGQDPSLRLRELARDLLAQRHG